MKIKFIPFNEDYIDELIKIHRISFKEHFNSKLGKNYVKNFIHWFVNDEAHKSIFLLAIDDESGKLIGYMCGAAEGFQSKFNKDMLLTTTAAFIKHPHLIFHPKFWQLFKSKIRSVLGKTEYPEFVEFELSLPKPIYSVNAFALQPEYREQGFGVYLLDEFFQTFFCKVTTIGYKTVSATIRSDNKQIFNYYKLRKWELYIQSSNCKTINFYKLF